MSPNANAGFVVISSLALFLITPPNASADMFTGSGKLLIGGPPESFAQQPKLPPTGFWAICAAGPGECVVQGDAPIAPRTPCYCAGHGGFTR